VERKRNIFLRPKEKPTEGKEKTSFSWEKIYFHRKNEENLKRKKTPSNPKRNSPKKQTTKKEELYLQEEGREELFWKIKEDSGGKKDKMFQYFSLGGKGEGGGTELPRRGDAVRGKGKEYPCGNRKEKLFSSGRFERLKRGPFLKGRREDRPLF